MAEWRFLRGWSSDELARRLQQLAGAPRNFDALDDAMTVEHGWRHYYSEAVIARDSERSASFERISEALANYRFSDPDIVTAHFEPDTPLRGRRLLLEVKVMGLRYLCPTVVTHVRDDKDTFGFRYDTLAGHIERGVEWFVVTRNETGDIRFRIEAHWKEGELPNWWSRLGFRLLAGRCQRRWHRRAHHRLAFLARHGPLAPPFPDAFGLAHQGIDVEFIYHSRKK